MRVGIDGGALSITDDRLKVGVYRVAFHLIAELPKIDRNSNYRIYRFERGEQSRSPSLRSGVSGRESSPKTDKNVQFVPLPRPGFQKVWQSLDMVRHPVDVYLGISQSLPYTLYDVKNVGFIYDVGFLDHPEHYRESYYTLCRQTADLVKRSHHIITISHASMASIRQKYHVPKEKLTVAHLGVSKRFVATGRKYRAANPYFLFVGALKPGKNIPMMLRSFARFLADVKQPYDFLLAGSDYWLDPGISATISALKLQHRVHFQGFVDDEVLAMYYRGAVGFVTVSDIEGFGLPALEAMACGTPVIASSIGSYPEVVGESGILVRPDDEEALSRALRTLTEDAKMRERLIEAGKIQAGKFSWRSFAKTVYDAAALVSSTK